MMRSTETNCSLTAEFSLVQEIISLQSERITQLYVIQSEQDPFLWFGVLFVDSGIYMGSVIRFNMFIDESYPDCSCPKIIFDIPPYHPLIDSETGELDTKNAFPDWSSKTHKLYQLLFFVKRTICQVDTYIKQIQELFSQHQICDISNRNPVASDSDDIALDETRPNMVPSTSLTENCDQMAAGDPPTRYNQCLIDMFFNFSHTLNVIRIYENNHDEFERRVNQFKHDSSHSIFDQPPNYGDDPNALIFTPWVQEIHEPIRNCVLAGRFKPTSLFASYHKETDKVSFVPGTELSK